MTNEAIVSGIVGLVGGAISGYGLSLRMVTSVVARALAEFRIQLSKGQDGFVTRRELSLYVGRKVHETEG